MDKDQGMRRGVVASALAAVRDRWSTTPSVFSKAGEAHLCPLLRIGLSLPVAGFPCCVFVWMASRLGFVWWCLLLCLSSSRCSSLVLSACLFRPSLGLVRL